MQFSGKEHVGSMHAACIMNPGLTWALSYSLLDITQKWSTCGLWQLFLANGLVTYTPRDEPEAFNH